MVPLMDSNPPIRCNRLVQFALRRCITPRLLHAGRVVGLMAMALGSARRRRPRVPRSIALQRDLPGDSRISAGEAASCH